MRHGTAKDTQILPDIEENGSMGTAVSITGEVEAGALGFTLMHEHILVCNWAMRQCFDDYVSVDDVIAEATTALNEAAENGVRTIVDLTPINLGRDVHVMARVAERTDVNIIAATGFYFHEEPWMAGWQVPELAEFLIRDIVHGIQGTRMRAGIIKSATDEPGVTDANRKLLQAAARAHLETGVPISTHTLAANKSGLAQQDVFADMGVDLSLVVIGHCGDTTDLDYLKKILDRGSVIGMDRFGFDPVLPAEDRVETIVRLAAEGYADQMVLSHDKACFLDFASRNSMAAVDLPNWEYSYVPTEVLPWLRKRGVNEADIAKMTVENPKRILAK